MNTGSPITFRQPNSGGPRKRPFSVTNTGLLSDYSTENSEDYNILSALGMKDRDIFQSPESTNLLMKRESETMGNFKVPISGSVAGGQSPYFNVINTPNTKPAMQDVQVAKPMNTDSHEAKTTAGNGITEKEQSPKLQPAASIPIINKENDDGTKPRKLRPIGEYTVSSLEKEYQEIVDFIKQDREQDQQLFLQCSKALRDKTESIIENLENIIKARYQSLDESLHSVIQEFEKEWNSGRKLEEEVNGLRNHMSSIMNNFLQDPCLE